MEGLKIQNNFEEEKENSDKYFKLLEKIREIYGNFILDSSDMESVFDEKYKDAGVVQLLDEYGEALIGKDGERVAPVEFEKIDNHNKQAHIRGLLYKLTLNPVNLADNLAKETALLRVLKVNGEDLEHMIDECREKNQA